MNTEEIIKSLQLTGKLMELHNENPFKVRSLTNAVFKLDKVGVDLSSASLEELEKIDGGKGEYSFDDMVLFVEKLLTQEKEEDAKIAEEEKINMDRRDRIYKYQIDPNQRWYDKGQNDACDNIAKAIRGK